MVVLILSGIEVIILIAFMALYFGFRMGIILIHQCFSCCLVVFAQSHSFSYCPVSEETEDAEEGGRGQNQDMVLLTPTDRLVPYGILWNYRSGGSWLKGCHFFGIAGHWLAVAIAE